MKASPKGKKGESGKPTGPGDGWKAKTEWSDGKGTYEGYLEVGKGNKGKGGLSGGWKGG